MWDMLSPFSLRMAYTSVYVIHNGKRERECQRRSEGEQMTKAGPERDGVEALWRLERETEAGPRPALSLADIVGAGIEIADAEGLAEVSMAKVAKRLGFSTMALYRHVPSKGELLTLMFDAGVGAPPSAILATSGWRTRMHVLAGVYLEIFQRRPWLLDIPITGPPMGPNNIRWLDTGLAILEETELDAGDRVEVFLLITSYLLGSVRLFVEMARAAAAAARSGIPLADAAGYGAALGRILPPGRFPAVEKAIAAGAFDGENTDDDELHRGLDHIMDGVEALMARRGVDGKGG
jgi:AcrR family transcriptional regulator